MKTSKHADAQAALVKIANTGAWYRDPAVMAAVAAPVAAVGVDAAVSGVKKLFAAQQKSRAFKSMVQENPHLKGRDTRNTQRYFNTLWRTNPEMAKDPIVAGSFVYGQHGAHDEGHPHRGILAAASDMSRMRSDMAKARQATRGPQYGGMVSSTIRDVAGAVQAGKARALEDKAEHLRGIQAEMKEEATRLRQANKAMDFPADLSSIARSSSMREDPGGSSPRRGGPRRRIVRGGGSGSTFHSDKEKKSSPSSLRALLGV